MIKTEHGTFTVKGSGMEIVMDLLTLFKGLEDEAETDEMFAFAVNIANKMKGKDVKEQARIFAEEIIKSSLE